MRFLIERISDQEEVWSSGCASFFIDHSSGIWRLPIAVRCRIGSLDLEYLALLDTGAEWSVIGGETAKMVEDELDFQTESLNMSTRLGRISGKLHRIEISLIADPNCGRDIAVESTVFVSDEWAGPLVLGYRGFLERIRFAFDPGMISGDQWFYFGVG